MNQLPPVTSEIDAGIRDLVRRLRESGFETVDSGDGTKRGPGTIPRPHVVILVTAPELIAVADDLLAWVRLNTTARMDRTWIEAEYSPIDGYATVTLLGVTDKELSQQ